MSDSKNYGREYFEGIYAHLKKEKGLLLESFLTLLFPRAEEIKRILDLGCAEGGFLEICQEKGIDVYGVDISAYALKKAKKRVKGELIRLDLENEKLPWPDGFFDVVTVFDLLEHLRSSNLLFSETQRVLKRGGLFFATTPNADFILAKSLGKVIPGDKTHVNLQGSKYWLDQLEKANFSKIEIKGCLLFGLPPSLNLRHFLRRLKIPVLTRPIFFPILSLTPELFLFAWKE